MIRGHSRKSYPHDKRIPIGRVRALKAWSRRNGAKAVAIRLHIKKQRQYNHKLECLDINLT